MTITLKLTTGSPSLYKYNAYRNLLKLLLDLNITYVIVVVKTFLYCIY